MTKYIQFPLIPLKIREYCPDLFEDEEGYTYTEWDEEGEYMYYRVNTPNPYTKVSTHKSTFQVMVF